MSDPAHRLRKPPCPCEMYDYFKVGDRVRYHPAFATYEKFDKSRDSIIYCNVCSMMNPVSNDRCERCANLLFK